MARRRRAVEWERLIREQERSGKNEVGTRCVVVRPRAPMVKYSEKFKARMVKRMTGPRRVSANALSKEVGVGQPTLSLWLRTAGSVASVSNPPPLRQRLCDERRNAQGHLGASRCCSRVLQPPGCQRRQPIRRVTFRDHENARGLSQEALQHARTRAGVGRSRPARDGLPHSRALANSHVPGPDRCWKVSLLGMFSDDSVVTIAQC